MAKVNPNNGNETKLDIFHGTFSNLTSFVNGRKKLKCVNDFYNCYLQVSLQRCSQTTKAK